MTMIDAVARAIGKKVTGTEYGWPAWRPVARAALEAMREPSEAMLKAGDLPGWDDSVTVGLSGEVWQAMIDAALTEGAKE